MHTIYYGKCPSYLSKNFEKSSRSGKSNFIIPIVKNAYLKKKCSNTLGLQTGIPFQRTSKKWKILTNLKEWLKNIYKTNKLREVRTYICINDISI